MQNLKSLPLILILLLGSGCLIVSLPAEHREEIDKLQSQITVGSTTKEEVISIFGEPDVTRDRFIMYLKKEYSGGRGWVVFTPGGSGGGSGSFGQVYMDLYFEFDNFGTLMKFRTNKYDKKRKTIKDDGYIPKAKVEDDCDPGMESCN